MTIDTAGSFDDEELRRLVEAKKAMLAEALASIERTIRRVLPQVDPTGLVRTHLVESRVKSDESLSAKGKAKGWSPEQTVVRAADLLGARIVCENLEDIPRVLELLKEALATLADDIPLTVQSHEGKEGSGYRGTHLNGRVKVGHPFRPEFFGFEIQIRTLLQDSWGKLTHRDVYKGEGVTAMHRTLAIRLADLLHTADNIAQDIRRDLAKPFKAPDTRPPIDDLTPEALAFTFHHVFGRDPAEWAIRQVLADCKRLGVHSGTTISLQLSDQPYREEVSLAYRRVLGTSLSNEHLFTLTPLAASKGTKAARRAAVRQAKRELAEAEAYFRNTALDALPSSVEDFLEQLEREGDDGDVSHFVTSLADALGALNTCVVCGQEIVDAGGLEAALCEQLEMEEDGRIAHAVNNCGVEVGYWNSTSICAYHGDQAAKDD